MSVRGVFAGMRREERVEHRTALTKYREDPKGHLELFGKR